MRFIPVIVVLSIILAVLAGYLWSIAWAVGDARRRGQENSLLVLLLVVVCWPFGLLIWLAVRSKQTVLETIPSAYTNAEDAMAAASTLDSIGEWNAAINLYRYSANRWPEHAAYVGK